MRRELWRSLPIQWNLDVASEQQVASGGQSIHAKLPIRIGPHPLKQPAVGLLGNRVNQSTHWIPCAPNDAFDARTLGENHANGFLFGFGFDDEGFPDQIDSTAGNALRIRLSACG